MSEMRRPEPNPAAMEAQAVPELLDECRAELDEARRSADEFRDKYLRTAAQIDNARKRAEREAQARAAEAQQAWLLELLTVVDNLERALDQPAEAAGLRRGVELTLRQLEQVLRRAGVERLPVAPGDPFDPSWHEAMAARVGDVPDDRVGAVMQAGYQRDGVLLRPARVVVEQPPGR